MKTNEDLVEIIRNKIKAHGDQKALAQKIGVSPGFLNDVLRGRAPVTKQIAEYFGYSKVTGFIKK